MQNVMYLNKLQMEDIIYRYCIFKFTFLYILVKYPEHSQSISGIENKSLYYVFEENYQAICPYFFSKHYKIIITNIKVTSGLNENTE